MTDPALTSEAPAGKRVAESRALEPSALFWLAMFAASALGTNLGDFWADGLSLGLVSSFATIAIISGLLIWGDRENGARTEVFFWLAIVLLRAAATNVGDFLTHALGLNYALAAAALGRSDAGGRLFHPTRPFANIAARKSSLLGWPCLSAACSARSAATLCRIF